MPNSFAQTASLTCTDCGRDFDAELWLIVDAAERPDLLDRARAGDLHDASCPHCDYSSWVDAPLLIHRPDSEPRLIFSPAEQTTPEQERDQAGALLGMLSQSLGPAWRDEWLEALATVPRQFLPAALIDDPEAAIAAMQAQVEAELERLAEEEPETFRELEEAAQADEAADPFIAGLMALLEADSTLTLLEAARDHPILLAEETGARLREGLEQGRGMPQEEMLQEALLRYEWLHGMLGEIADAGGSLEQAIEVARAGEEEDSGTINSEQLTENGERTGTINGEQSTVNGERTDDAEADAMPPALQSLLAELATEGVEIRSEEDLDQLLAERPDLRARFAAAMQEAAPPLLQTIDRFVRAQSWGESQRIVEANPVLLSDEAIDRMNDMIAFTEGQGDEDTVRILREHRTLLDRCREAGIARAFAEKVLPPEALAQAAAAGLAPEEFLEMQQAAAQMAPELREVLAELAAEGVEINSPADLERALAARPELRAKLEAAAGATGGGPDAPPHFSEDLQRAQQGEQRYRQTGDLAGLDAAAAAWTRILDHPDFETSDARFQLVVLNDSGGVFLRRYWAQGRIEDLNRALSSWQRAVSSTPPDSPDRPGYLNNLGNGLSDRYARTGRLGDLEEAIRAYEEAVSCTPPDSSSRSMYLNNLGLGLIARYVRTGRLGDLEEAIRVYEEAVSCTPPDSRSRPSRLNNLGNGLSDCYARTGRLGDLEEAIRVYEEAVSCTPPDSPDRPGYLNNLGTGLSSRYVRTGRLGDLEEAIRVSEEAVECTPPGLPSRPMYLNNLGNGLRSRYARTGRLGDLEEAIGAYEAAVEQTPIDSPFRPSLFTSLGNGLSDRCARTGRLADLEEAIRAYEEAVESTPPDSPDRPSLLNNLGAGLSDRYARTGRLADLEEAIRVTEEAVSSTPPDSPDRPSLLNNLGAGLRSRYARTGRMADLEEALRVSEEAVESTPPDSPSRPMYLNNLGNELRSRYARTGRLGDLEGAIRVYKEAVEMTPSDSPSHPMYLNNLGAGLSSRYARTGRLDDLEEALRVYGEAVESTPPDSPDRPSFLNNLGNGLSDRYARTGRLGDLEEALRVYREAVERTPLDSPGRPSRLNNLGTSLRDRYARTGRLDDLEEALRVYEEAVSSTLPDFPDRPTLLTNLGNGLSARYARTGRLGDLEKAIRVYELAMERTPSNSPDRPGYLNNLGTGLRSRYARMGRLDDLEEAIRVCEEAVSSTLPDYPDRPTLLNNLGNGLRDRYARMERMGDLKEAIRVYEEACIRGLEVTPEEAIRSSKNWGNWALEREKWQEAIDAYQYAFDAIDQLLGVQLQRGGKEAWLREVQGLPARAAFAHTKLGDLEAAVTTLENGRTRLLGEALEATRTDLERLPALGHKAEHDRYLSAIGEGERIRQRLQTPLQEQPDGFDRAALSRELETAEAKHKTAIAAIQQIEGYEDFFKPVTFEDIAAAAQDAPLVYLLTTPQGGLALIVHGERVEAVWLNFSEDELRALLYGPADDPLLGGWYGAYAQHHRDRAAWAAAINNVTRSLWTRAMGPVAAALAGLGCMPAADADVRVAPVVTLIPTGLLALLPLHAAWTQSEEEPSGRHYFLDDYAVRYAPSATALSRAGETAAAILGQGMLAVNEPQPVKGPRLPNTRLEVAAILDLFQQPVELAGKEATHQAVLDALPGKAVAHFSCHGLNDWGDPLATGLYMANDEPLTVRDLMARRDANARLAVLSACETGIAGRELPDEVIAFPTALLQAGFAGVAASLWSVADVSTMMVMVRFYEHWRVEGLEPFQALRMAQRWVRDSTNWEKAEYFGAYLSDISDERMPAEVAEPLFQQHILSNPESRPFAHPFWWAAFTYTGV